MKLFPGLAIGTLAVAAGILAEAKFDIVGRLMDRPAVAIVHSGPGVIEDNDPGLLAWLARPVAPRPGAASAAEDWTAWQARTRDELREIYGFDDRDVDSPAPTRIHEESVEDGLRRLSLSVQSADGTWIPSVLFLPPTTARTPAIVVIPGHVRPGQSGLGQLTGTDDSYQHSAARRLAEAGFVTLALELRGFGTLGPPRHPEHEQVAYNAILAGTFYKALVARDIQAAITYLVTRPEVDPARLAIAGASLGGEIAVDYAAMDERIRAIAFHSHGGSVGNFRGADGERWPHYCHMIPGSGRRFRQEDVFALLAPRPVLALRGTEQPFGDPAFEASLRAAWAAVGGDSHLTIGSAPGAHEFFVTPTAEFFLSTFGRPPPPPRR